ncbi:MAG TPA: hypothetical protein VJL59_25625 [Anaerolineales bacterium]|nr:hypothetical protein [Anaerolineales bacterium]
MSYASTPPTFYWHPTSGLPTNDIEALALTPSALYAGTFGDSIYRSTDNGATWLTATTGITLPMSVQNALAVHPLTPTIVYAGDYYGSGLYRSLDGGENAEEERRAIAPSRAPRERGRGKARQHGHEG